MFNYFLCRGLMHPLLNLFLGTCGRLKMSINSLHLLPLVESTSPPLNLHSPCNFLQPIKCSRINNILWPLRLGLKRSRSFCSALFWCFHQVKKLRPCGRRFCWQRQPPDMRVSHLTPFSLGWLPDDCSHVNNHRWVQQKKLPAKSSPNCWPTELWTSKMLVLRH